MTEQVIGAAVDSSTSTSDLEHGAALTFGQRAEHASQAGAAKVEGIEDLAYAIDGTPATRRGAARVTHHTSS